MKKMLKNKKGFTLVELLAVIVILAIIMVIATQRIGDVIAGARADSFVESYQMIAKQVQTNMMAGKTDAEIKCSTDSDCQTNYGLSTDYSLNVTGDSSSGFTVTLKPTTDSKFKNIDLVNKGKTKCGNVIKHNVGAADEYSEGTINAGVYSAKCYTQYIKGTVK